MPRVKTWLAHDAIRTLAEAANAKYPLETGGLLLGYWSGIYEAVISSVSLPGPEAKHYRYSYRPDYEHDIEVVRRVYTGSKGVHTYLGDWHSHPGTTRPYLSIKDRLALHRIANSFEARTARPLSMVCGFRPNDWRLRYGLVRRLSQHSAFASSWRSRHRPLNTRKAD